jgi:hypothetical protein
MPTPHDASATPPGHSTRDDALLLLQRPLSQQLELLHLWHAALSARLAAFLQQFKAAGGRILLAAGGCVCV